MRIVLFSRTVLHGTQSIKIWMKDHQIKTLSWPVQPPDLNPTESLCSVRERLVESMAGCMKAVIDNWVIICIFGLACICQCFSPSLSRGGAVLLCVPKRYLCRWKLLIGWNPGGCWLVESIWLGHSKVEPAADLTSLSLSFTSLAWFRDSCEIDVRCGYGRDFGSLLYIL